MPVFCARRRQGAGADGGLDRSRRCRRCAAVVLWRSYGGSVYPPELAAVAAGHVLNAALTIALAAAAASLTDHPSTAAIVTLSVTVGTWIVNFIAAVHGGVWERAAGYTPTAMVAEFQHGLVRLDVAAGGGGARRCSAWCSPRSGCASAWRVRRRVYESIGARRADRRGDRRRARSSRRAGTSPKTG